jgi:hypothetical protein
MRDDLSREDSTTRLSVVFHEGAGTAGAFVAFAPVPVEPSTPIRDTRHVLRCEEKQP